MISFLTLPIRLVVILLVTAFLFNVMAPLRSLELKLGNINAGTETLSQWFESPFSVDGCHYPTAEHWMMAEKARLFGDDEMLAEILAAPDPKSAKAFGRKVSRFDQETWNANRVDIVTRGNIAKFDRRSAATMASLNVIRNESSLISIRRISFV